MIVPKLPLSPRALRPWKRRPELEFSSEGQTYREQDAITEEDGDHYSEDTPSSSLSVPGQPNAIILSPSSPSPISSKSLIRKRFSGFFNTDPPRPSSESSPSPSLPCVSPGNTLTYRDVNGTVNNYTNLGGNCAGLDYGETGSQPITNITGNYSSLQDPFYASVTPQTFALAGATIAAAILLILLFLSRTRKPWIQKLATLSTTMSLVTFMVVSVNLLKEQYADGRYDADTLRQINQKLVVKVLAFIADFTVYAAQVQTLMRIFPRKKDKVIIKWTGFCLILLTMIFYALFQFLQPLAPQPDERNSAWDTFLIILPPFNYLFSIALSLIYAACVFYFGIVHRRVAFTVPAGLILAFLSVACVTVPVIFFCLDVWETFVVGWGQFIRSVASLGSTVIVWEWVERVDESEYRKVGKNAVLGRRVFEDEFEVGKTPTPYGSTASGDVWRGLGKIRIPSIFSGVSSKANEWSLKLQSMLDRRESTANALPAVDLALSDMAPATSTSQNGAVTASSTHDENRTTVTGDDTYSSSSFSGTTSATQNSFVGRKPPKKKHQYPIARTTIRTRESSQSTTVARSPPIERVRESVFQPSTSLEPSAPYLHSSDRDSLRDRPISLTAPSFHSRESEDQRAQTSELHRFTTGGQFSGSDEENCGSQGNGQIS